MGHNIIHWNCRGLRSNRENLELLVNKHKPLAICLQETKLGSAVSPSFKYYSTYYNSTESGHGGVALLVKNSFVHSVIPLTTNLQAVAACITICNKSYTICSIYVPPSSTLHKHDLDHLVDQLPVPYIYVEISMGTTHFGEVNLLMIKVSL